MRDVVNQRRVVREDGSLPTALTIETMENSSNLLEHKRTEYV